MTRGRMTRLLQRDPVASLLAAAFCLFGLTATLVLALSMPPFQNPDEENHFKRAAQLDRGELFPPPFNDWMRGGEVDGGICQTEAPFHALPFYQDRKVSQAMFASVARVHWGRATCVAYFPNTVPYPPVLYAPAMAAIAVGKVTRSSVLRTFYAARIATGVCATLVAATAVLLAAGAAPWLFAVLTLPMTLSLFASVSQDGLMIASAALAASLLASAGSGPRPVRDAHIAVLGVCLAAICIARPPYLPLALPLLVVPWRGPWARVAVVAAIAAVTLGWAGAVLLLAGVDVAPDVTEFGARRQLAALMAAPARLPALLVDTLRAHWADYLEQFIGQLGWLDVRLPAGFRTLAGAVLLLAALCCAGGTRLPSGWQRHRAAMVLAAILLIVAGVLTLEYLTFTAVGGTLIQGVQGRYFLVPALFLIACVSPRPTGRARWSAWPLPLVAAFPAATIAMVVRAILLRYYL